MNARVVGGLALGIANLGRLPALFTLGPRAIFLRRADSGAFRRAAALSLDAVVRHVGFERVAQSVGPILESAVEPDASPGVLAGFFAELGRRRTVQLAAHRGQLGRLRHTQLVGHPVRVTIDQEVLRARLALGRTRGWPAFDLDAGLESRSPDLLAHGRIGGRHLHALLERQISTVGTRLRARIGRSALLVDTDLHRCLGVLGATLRIAAGAEAQIEDLCRTRLAALAADRSAGQFATTLELGLGDLVASRRIEAVEQTQLPHALALAVAFGFTGLIGSTLLGDALLDPALRHLLTFMRRLAFGEATVEDLAGVAVAGFATWRRAALGECAFVVCPARALVARLGTGGSQFIETLAPHLIGQRAARRVARCRWAIVRVAQIAGRVGLGGADRLGGPRANTGIEHRLPVSLTTRAAIVRRAAKCLYARCELVVDIAIAIFGIAAPVDTIAERFVAVVGTHVVAVGRFAVVVHAGVANLAFAPRAERGIGAGLEATAGLLGCVIGASIDALLERIRGSAVILYAGIEPYTAELVAHREIIGLDAARVDANLGQRTAKRFARRRFGGWAVGIEAALAELGGQRVAALGFGRIVARTLLEHTARHLVTDLLTRVDARRRRLFVATLLLDAGVHRLIGPGAAFELIPALAHAGLEYDVLFGPARLGAGPVVVTADVARAALRERIGALGALGLGPAAFDTTLEFALGAAPATVLAGVRRRRRALLGKAGAGDIVRDAVAQRGIVARHQVCEAAIAGVGAGLETMLLAVAGFRWRAIESAARRDVVGDSLAAGGIGARLEVGEAGVERVSAGDITVLEAVARLRWPTFGLETRPSRREALGRADGQPAASGAALDLGCGAHPLAGRFAVIRPRPATRCPAALEMRAGHIAAKHVVAHILEAAAQDVIGGVGAWRVTGRRLGRLALGLQTTGLTLERTLGADRFGRAGGSAQLEFDVARDGTKLRAFGRCLVAAATILDAAPRLGLRQLAASLGRAALGETAVLEAVRLATAIVLARTLAEARLLEAQLEGALRHPLALIARTVSVEASAQNFVAGTAAMSAAFLFGRRTLRQSATLGDLGADLGAVGRLAVVAQTGRLGPVPLGGALGLAVLPLTALLDEAPLSGKLGLAITYLALAARTETGDAPVVGGHVARRLAVFGLRSVARIDAMSDHFLGSNRAVALVTALAHAHREERLAVVGAALFTGRWGVVGHALGVDAGLDRLGAGRIADLGRRARRRTAGADLVTDRFAAADARIRVREAALAVQAHANPLGRFVLTVHVGRSVEDTAVDERVAIGLATGDASVGSRSADAVRALVGTELTFGGASQRRAAAGRAGIPHGSANGTTQLGTRRVVRHGADVDGTVGSSHIGDDVTSRAGASFLLTLFATGVDERVTGVDAGAAGIRLAVTATGPIIATAVVVGRTLGLDASGLRRRGALGANLRLAAAADARLALAVGGPGTRVEAGLVTRLRTSTRATALENLLLDAAALRLWLPLAATRFVVPVRFARALLLAQAFGVASTLDDEAAFGLQSGLAITGLVAAPALLAIDARRCRRVVTLRFAHHRVVAARFANAKLDGERAFLLADTRRCAALETGDHASQAVGGTAAVAGGDRRRHFAFVDEARRGCGDGRLTADVHRPGDTALTLAAHIERGTPGVEATVGTGGLGRRLLWIWRRLVATAADEATLARLGGAALACGGIASGLDATFERAGCLHVALLLAGRRAARIDETAIKQSTAVVIADLAHAPIADAGVAGRVGGGATGFLARGWIGRGRRLAARVATGRRRRLTRSTTVGLAAAGLAARRRDRLADAIAMALTCFLFGGTAGGDTSVGIGVDLLAAARRRTARAAACGEPLLGIVRAAFLAGHRLTLAAFGGDAAVDDLDCASVAGRRWSTSAHTSLAGRLALRGAGFLAGRALGRRLDATFLEATQLDQRRGFSRTNRLRSAGATTSLVMRVAQLGASRRAVGGLGRRTVGLETAGRGCRGATFALLGSAAGALASLALVLRLVGAEKLTRGLGRQTTPIHAASRSRRISFGVASWRLAAGREASGSAGVGLRVARGRASGGIGRSTVGYTAGDDRLRAARTQVWFAATEDAALGQLAVLTAAGGFAAVAGGMLAAVGEAASRLVATFALTLVLGQVAVETLAADLMPERAAPRTARRVGGKRVDALDGASSEALLVARRRRRLADRLRHARREASLKGRRILRIARRLAGGVEGKSHLGDPGDFRGGDRCLIRWRFGDLAACRTGR